MSKQWTHLADNAIQKTDDSQIIINRFNAEIRKMNSAHYKKLEAEKRKEAAANKKRKN